MIIKDTTLCSIKMDENECPICFEPMTSSVTKVYLGCCKQELRLACFKRCGFKCPFCRNDDQELTEIRVPQETQEERLIPPQPPIVTTSSTARETIMFYQRLIVMVTTLFLSLITFLLVIISSNNIC